MKELTQNLYNRRQNRTGQKLKLWRYAGLLLTYRCSAACRFCSYFCSPRSGGLMPYEIALQAWDSLVKLAGPAAHIHITGGEPFLYFDHLAGLLEEAAARNYPPLNSLETNGFWAQNQAEAREKLHFLHKIELQELAVSFDPFHAEFVPLEAVRTLQTLAQEILGPHRVKVRWGKYLENCPPIEVFLDPKNRTVLQKMLEEDRCRFTGRAAESIGPLAAKFPLETIEQQSCQNAFLNARGVHIDPFGNVFCGQCSGIILGNLYQKPLELLWETFDPPGLPFWNQLFESGPAGLLPQAVADGYQPTRFYASKCHLCTDIRRFFLTREVFCR
ncbi:MAG TPA: radical SAM protein [Anaerohalosphaeraceae bacterium]|nr:radical SAM protein [Anaerohalosphaeraceae bacterium]HOL89919.1 radical SAM protein [Anaerohalosphaeraceae bacterium]HPP57246.1 radical SAM protein [Anaerohalosphaeraceae bacterium]